MNTEKLIPQIAEEIYERYSCGFEYLCEQLYGRDPDCAKDFLKIDSDIEIGEYNVYYALTITPRVETDEARYSEYDGDFDVWVSEVDGVESLKVDSVTIVDENDNEIKFSDRENKQLQKELEQLWKN